MTTVHHPGDGYAGPATVTAATRAATDPGRGAAGDQVQVHLSGRFEPLDGRYHWGGRLLPGGRPTAHLATGERVTLRIGRGTPAVARLGEADPWGGVRITGTGAPPWPDPPDPPDPPDLAHLAGPPARQTPDPGPDRAPTAPDTRVAIVGAGFGGLAAAIALAGEGERDFLIFEQAHDIGGTWRDNTYPGCACDVPSHLYSYSFAGNPGWSHTFSGQREIWQYLRDCVDRFGLRRHLRLGRAVHGATWDQAAAVWRLETSHGQVTARFLVSATGPLSVPSMPDIPGLDTFAGTVFHSARWRHDHDLTGRRVAVIGTGASAVQFVPAVAAVAADLTVVQRTPPWILPRRSRPIGPAERAVYRHVPGAQRAVRTAIYWGRELQAFGFLHPAVNRVLQRLAVRHLRRQVPDPALRAALTPRYTMGCKRVLLSNDYLPALTRPNVHLVTGAVRAVTPRGVVTADGVECPVDTIVLGTGFRVTDLPIAERITGRDGRSLAEAFAPTMRAYAGTTVAGFPNLFLLLGPNTGLGHTSVIIMIESQVRYLLGALRHLRRTGGHAIEPTERAQRRWVARVDARMAGTVWLRGGCRSWYLDATGRNATLWPGYATGFRLRLRRFRAADHTVSGATGAAAPAADVPTTTGARP